MLKKIYVFIGVLLGIFCFFFFSLSHAMAQPTKTMAIPSTAIPSIAMQAKPTSPLEKKISYYVLQQTVGLAIQDIATQISVPVVIAHNVKGKVAAGKYEGTARDILNQIMADSNLHWYFDGRSIQVTSVQDAIMHVVQLNSFSFSALEMALHTINLDTNGFPIRYDSYNNMAIIYGPPKYVATIEVVAHHLATRASQKPQVIRG